MIEKKPYIIVFLITVALFALAFLLSDKLSNTKINQLREIQDKISLDILSIETRYALLGTSSCQHVISNETFEKGLNEELNNLAKRVKFMESELGSENGNVLRIKQQYNLLQIKDYLLRQDLNTRCGEEIISILYFHESDCRDCQTQSAVLDELADRYPEVRIYWLDRDLQTPAMETLVSMFEVENSPSIILNGELVEGLQSIADFEDELPKELVQAYKSLNTESSTSTDE
jgi:glutaredoxin